MKLIDGYYVDCDNNKWSAKKYSEIQALLYQETCTNCEDCVDCINCTDCLRCVECKDCNGCVDCTKCTNCLDMQSEENTSEDWW